jgi:hypothetical protein
MGDIFEQGLELRREALRRYSPLLTIDFPIMKDGADQAILVQFRNGHSMLYGLGNIRNTLKHIDLEVIRMLEYVEI